MDGAILVLSVLIVYWNWKLSFSDFDKSSCFFREIDDIIAQRTQREKGKILQTLELPIRMLVGETEINIIP